MGNKIIFHEIIAEQPKELASGFYGKLFNWDIQEDPTIPFWYISSDDGENFQAGIGQVSPENPPYRKTVTFYVQVDSVDDYLQKANELGGTTMMKKTVFSFKQFQYTIGMFSDPQGNVIGVMEPIEKL